MKGNKIFITILLVSTALLAACTQDELAEQSTMLPEGAYPLQIGSVTIDAQSSQQPMTRVAENSTGEGSLWQTGDQIHVRIGNNTETGIYEMGVSGSNIMVSSMNEIYWKSTRPATVTAWYSNIEGSATVSANTISLADQSKGLAYVIQAVTSNATYGSEVNLAFKHQLAKVRVKLNGTQVTDDMKVEVNNYTACTVADGAVSATTTGWITMHKTSYGNATTTVYEANVVPGTVANPNNLIRVGGQFNATGINLTELAAGQIYTIDLTVGDPVIDVSTYEGTTITLTQDTYITGTSTDKRIIIDGDIEVTLEEANINSSIVEGGGYYTNIPLPTMQINNNSNVTLIVKGQNNKIIYTANDNASRFGGSSAITLGSGASITIQGATGRDSDKLIATSGSSDKTSEMCAAIGSSQGVTCGDITIKNVTVEATGNISFSIGGPGIGAGYKGGCGNIVITDAIVTATAGTSGAGIGGGCGSSLDGGGNCGDIVITNSIVTATGGDGGAGIGGGEYSSCGDIIIKESVVKATGGDGGAGIGMGSLGINTTISMGAITITDSDVTAEGKSNSAAIGFSFPAGPMTLRAGLITITSSTEDYDTLIDKLTVESTWTNSSTPYKIGKSGCPNGSASQIKFCASGSDTDPWPGVKIKTTDVDATYTNGVCRYETGASE